MKTKLITLASVVLCAVAQAAITVSPKMATNIAERVVEQKVTKEFMESKGIVTEETITNVTQDVVADTVDQDFMESKGIVTRQAVTNIARNVVHHNAPNIVSNIVTKAYIDEKEPDMATKTWVGNQGYLTEHQDISGKQDKLYSGTNIKTVNNQSLLGAGNIMIEGGGGGSMPDNGLVLTNDAVKTKSGTPVTATHVGAATTAELEATRQIVYTWENFLDGSNVVFSITNYVSGAYNINSPKLRIKELRDGTNYVEVYNSASEIQLYLADFETNKYNVAFSNLVDAVADMLANKANKSWGQYTSTGGDAPSNTVYMTAPNTVFAGGMEYERVAVGEGSICVLTTKGAPTYTSGDEGTFKFQDDGGTNYFGFAKTDSYVIGCNTDGISVDSSTHIVTLRYDLTMSGVPCIWYKASLSNNTPWEQLNLPDGNPVAGASKLVTWELNPPAGQELCYINCTEESGFFKATIEVAGSAKFMTNMPSDLGGGVLCTDGLTIIYPHSNGTWTTTK